MDCMEVINMGAFGVVRVILKVATPQMCPKLPQKTNLQSRSGVIEVEIKKGMISNLGVGNGFSVDRRV